MNWEALDQLNDTNDMWNLFYSYVTGTLNIMCPIITLRIPENKPKWMTKEVVKMMRERDKFFAKARRTQNEDTWSIARFWRNQVQMAIKQYKTDFIRQQLHRNKKNPRKFWDNIRELLPNSKDNIIKSLYDQPSDKTIDKNELPMYINSFCTSIGENLARPLLKYKPQTNDVPGADIDLEIQLEQQESLTKVISVEEVKLFVDTIDTAKSAAMQNMKTMVLKDAFQAKPEYLCKVFNSSLQKCQFPASWKKSNIVPLPKVPNVKVANDLRPISLLPLPGKVLGKNHV